VSNGAVRLPEGALAFCSARVKIAAAEQQMSDLGVGELAIDCWLLASPMVQNTRLRVS
jgi:hypothetical protein